MLVGGDGGWWIGGLDVGWWIGGLDVGRADIPFEE